jgi:hypothetical protein
VSAITVFQPGFPPTISDDDWMHRWPCRCFVLSGWNAETGEAVAIFNACRDPGPHAAPMERARERFASMVEHPKETAELANKTAIEIIQAIAEQELSA